MDNINISKRTQKDSQKSSSWLSKLISKVLISVIFVLASLIYTNISSDNYVLYKEKIINNNLRYSKFKNYYEKYLGRVLPKNEGKVESVLNTSIKYDHIEDYGTGEKIVFNQNTVIEAIQSGLVVYLGNKDELGYTAIIQGIDDVDVWYSNITNCNLKLYDYVEKNKVIGETSKDLIINIIKNNNHLKYEEYIKTI